MTQVLSPIKDLSSFGMPIKQYLKGPLSGVLNYVFKELPQLADEPHIFFCGPNRFKYCLIDPFCSNICQQISL